MLRVRQAFGVGRNLRQYQTRSGVFGYRPRNPSKFQVPQEIRDARNANSNLFRWIEAYRRDGHHVASVNPVEFSESERNCPSLNPETYGLNSRDPARTQNLLGANHDSDVASLKQLLDRIYCGTVSAEFSFISSEEERLWISERYEKIFQEKVVDEERRKIAELMLKSQAWDNFLATKFPTVKRYGGEGNESFFAFFHQLFLSGAEAELQGIVLGMPHRGKLNLLTVLLNTRPAKIFRKFRGLPEFPPTAKAMSDIASHFHASEDLTVGSHSLHVSMLHNPSHLEAVNPVSMGKCRSKQQSARDGAFNDDAAKPFGDAFINVQLHGDAAFAGQGINQESLFLQGTPHYEVGGTIHLVVNNQVGFTTPSDRGKCTKYCTDLAKSIEAPVFHVNADDPERLAQITRLAFEYRKQFQKDVFIDLNCFRRWGHNELDDPTFTNPALYRVIHARPSIPDSYSDLLIREGVLTPEERDSVVSQFTSYLQEEFSAPFEPSETYFRRQWEGQEQPQNALTRWDTGVGWDVLSFVGLSSVYVPETFNVHPHLQKTVVATRQKKMADGQKIDWATAEALAMGSLMYQGFDVRLSGEDVGRGTFSQRHAMLVDQESNEIFVPLNAMKGGLGGKLELANTILSEEAVLGFEYGYATDNPDRLVVWEAQFGDFFNGAQIIIDAFIASGETKWMQANGLVMLLPHGMDGAASEHSSCRIERFLQMTDSKEASPDGDDVNMQVVNPTTPAQYFHLLRRQLLRNFRKPLVVVAPKTLLRLSEAASTYADFLPGKTFEPVMGDPTVNPKTVKKVVLCSGKHYYNLREERSRRKDESVALVRVESLCPFPVLEIQEELAKFPAATSFIWSQEEHRNMGAWNFIQPRFENMCGRRIKYSGRYEAASPAVGVSSWHKKEVEDILRQPFEIK